MGAVKSEHVAEGITLFVESELLPALDGWRMWAGAAALALAHQRIGEIFDSLRDNKIVSALGLIDKDGMVNTESALDALKQTARKHGKLPVEIPVLDISFNFTEKDVETLRGYINKAAGVEHVG